MESLGKDQAQSDSSPRPSAAPEEHAVPDVINTRRLRDRELLRKRKMEVQEQESVQWILRQHENKTKRRGRRGRRGGRGRGRQPEVEPRPEPEPEPEPDPKPDSQEESEPAPPEPVPSEPAPSEPAHQEELPVLTIQDLASVMELTEGELEARSQDLSGEEEVLKPSEAELSEALNTPLEDDD